MPKILHTNRLTLRRAACGSSLLTATLLGFACSGSGQGQENAEGEVESLEEVSAEGDSRLFAGIEPSNVSAVKTSVNGRAVEHLGAARYAEEDHIEAPTEGSATPAEGMSRDELARAFQAVSVIEGQVYRATEPNYELADAIIEMRSVQDRLFQEKAVADAQEPAEEPLVEKSIVGTDSRTRVTDTLSSFYKRVAFLGLPGTCTGFMIGPRTALTAAHCIWSRSQNNWIHAGKTFNPGNDAGDAGPWPQDWDNGTWYPTIAQGWVDVGGVDWDLAVINFNNDVGDQTGWFGLDASPSVIEQRIYNAGYPSSPPNGGPWGAMYRSMQWNGSANEDVTLNSTTVRFSHDTSGGHSGGPLVVSDRVFAVFTNHGTAASPWNWGCRITSSWVSLIDQWSDYEASAWWGSNAARR